MRHGSLFSGIGGFDLAAEWMGWENIFHCEWNTFGQRILKHYWPQATTYADIKKTDFSIHRGQIEILTGGFPCQPYSVAGKRKGKEDDRHLWPEMLRAIREIQPSWIVGENVGGIVTWDGGLVFEEVQTDLENEGYEVQAFLLPAAGVGAPHRRDRIWFIAHTNGGSDNRTSRQDERKSKEEWLQERDKVRKPNKSSDVLWTTSNTNRDNASITPNFKQNARNGERNSKTNKGKRYSREHEPLSHTNTSRNNTINNRFEGFPTQSALHARNDGLSSRLDGITFSKWRNESIKGSGNAIVPQVALNIFKVIQDMESQQTLF